MTDDQHLAEVLKKFMRDDHNYVRLQEWEVENGEFALDGYITVTADEAEAIKRYDRGDPYDRKTAHAEDAAKGPVVEAGA